MDSTQDKDARIAQLEDQVASLRETVASMDTLITALGAELRARPIASFEDQAQAQRVLGVGNLGFTVEPGTDSTTRIELAQSSNGIVTLRRAPAGSNPDDILDKFYDGSIPMGGMFRLPDPSRTIDAQVTEVDGTGAITRINLAEKGGAL